MAEPFKNLIAPDLVRTAAKHLGRVWPAFPRRRFVQLATDGLDALELKARVRHVAAALAATLPSGFAAAADVLEQALAPARTDTDLAALVPGPDGLAGWIVWPMTEFVAEHGLGEPKRALQALHAMTQRNTAEYAIRPFVVAHEELTFRTLRRWLSDPSAHVRRLVSEGTRPRLPWGMQLRALVADPTPTLPLLERLQDDPSDYVRRSVANHLNDVAKDHPDVVVDWLERHLPAASSERRALLRHASRTLIKRGDGRVLRAWGVADPLRGAVSLTIAPGRVRVGGEVTLAVELVSVSRREQALLVDYVVHQPRPAGRTSAKTWKGWQLRLAPGERRQLTRRHSLRPVTTRRDHPGTHAVDLVVNGRVVAHGAFELSP
jgi:3-methyladenine DNA glycosylase AlkC